MKNVLVLLSGGMDSMLCAARAHQAGCLRLCVFVDYGQRAWVWERTAASNIAQRFGCELIESKVTLGGMEPMLSTQGEGPRVVWHRNLALVSVAATHAYELIHGIREIWLGCNLDDVKEYPDCRPAFVRALNKTLALSAPTPLTVKAPLATLSKRGIVRELTTLNIDPALSWSCYAPTHLGQPCEKCSACQRRALALVEARKDSP